MTEKYFLNESKTAIIDINISAFEDNTIVFPSEVDGHKISVICMTDNTLKNLNNTFKKFDVIIEDGIKGIADGMFKYSNINSISIPPSVQLIPPCCFFDSKLKEITFTGESTLRIIGDFAFYKCTKLKSISLPKTVKILAEDAFSETGLQEIAFLNEDGIGIGDLAFANCRSLKKVSFLKTEAAFGKHVFYLCDSLATVDMNKVKTSAITSSMFFGCRSLKQITLPSTVTEIGDSAFYCCDSLTSVGLGATQVTEIQSRAFENCLKYNDGKFPDTIKKINKYAFSGCKIDRLEIPIFSLIEVGDHAFSRNPFSEGLDLLPFVNCDTIGDFVFSECGVKFIQLLPFRGENISCKWMFEECPNLEKVNSTGEAQLFEGMFNNCNNLTEVILANTITSIPEFTFSKCQSLKYIDFPESIEKIDKFAFRDTGLESLDLSKSKFINIHNHAFYCTEALKDVKVPTFDCTIASNSFAKHITNQLIEKYPFITVNA